MVRALVSALFLLCCANAVATGGAFDRSHAAWTGLLGRHVHWDRDVTATRVDYAGFAGDAALLSTYLETLSGVRSSEFRDWPKDDREAFLINAYNAATVQLILTRYPDLESIKDLGGLFSSPWKKKFIDLLGDLRSLDAIEHELLRGAADYSDPRIHFAVNCASIGCPALRPEAYAGATLHAQLEDQTRRFLSDRSRNRFDADRGQLEISRIFDWYAQDFDAHAGGVRAFLSDHAMALGLDARRTLQLRGGEMPIDFGEYDWSLNRMPLETRP